MSSIVESGSGGPAASWRDRDAELLSPAYSRYSDLVVDRASGSYLHTVDGREVLDLGCGIGVTNLGHCHPEVVAAVHDQVDRLWHTSVTTLNVTMIETAAALVDVAPPGLDQVFLNNSGAEAVEAALKLARKATGRTEFIAFTGSFHGRTYGALSLTASKAKYRAGVGPILPGIHHVTYPHCFRTCSHPPDDMCPLAAGEEILRLFDTRVAPETVAAIVVEPFQGEGGFVIPPRAFLPRLRQLCDEHGILLIADEVQSGFARTGRMWAVDHTDTVPDIMCVAKAFGNGLPIAGILARPAVMGAWHPGDHGTTYGGNPIACAAAGAVIRTITRDRLDDRAARLGSRALERIRTWMGKVPTLGDVRGAGLWIGLEFMRGRVPAADVAQHVQQRALADNVLLLTCGTDGNVIRLMPPLTIAETDLDRALDVLERCLTAAG